MLANASATLQSLLAPLQSVLHSAARVVLTWSHTLIRESLHWLPVTERINFKLATLTNKCINGRALDYIIYMASMCMESSQWKLRSATAGKL